MSSGKITGFFRRTKRVWFRRLWAATEQGSLLGCVMAVLGVGNDVNRPSASSRNCVRPRLGELSWCGYAVLCNDRTNRHPTHRGFLSETLKRLFRLFFRVIFEFSDGEIAIIIITAAHTRKQDDKGPEIFKCSLGNSYGARIMQWVMLRGC